jgi:hypothetical protein
LRRISISKRIDDIFQKKKPLIIFYFLSIFFKKKTKNKEKRKPFTVAGVIGQPHMEPMVV